MSKQYHYLPIIRTDNVREATVFLPSDTLINNSYPISNSVLIERLNEIAPAENIQLFEIIQFVNKFKHDMHFVF